MPGVFGALSADSGSDLSYCFPGLHVVPGKDETRAEAFSIPCPDDLDHRGASGPLAGMPFSCFHFGYAAEGYLYGFAGEVSQEIQRFRIKPVDAHSPGQKAFVGAAAPPFLVNLGSHVVSPVFFRCVHGSHTRQGIGATRPRLQRPQPDASRCCCVTLQAYPSAGMATRILV